MKLVDTAMIVQVKVERCTQKESRRNHISKDRTREHISQRLWPTLARYISHGNRYLRHLQWELKMRVLQWRLSLSPHGEKGILRTKAVEVHLHVENSKYI